MVLWAWLQKYVQNTKGVEDESRPLMCNGHSPTETSVRSGVTVMQRPWPLAKANGFILVWESLTGIIPVRLLRSHAARWSDSNHGG
jgi:hypothetical protein